jgi:hypothetical protein
LIEQSLHSKDTFAQQTGPFKVKRIADDGLLRIDNFLSQLMHVETGGDKYFFNSIDGKSPFWLMNVGQFFSSTLANNIKSSTEIALFGSPDILLKIPNTSS